MTPTLQEWVQQLLPIVQAAAANAKAMCGLDPAAEE